MADTEFVLLPESAHPEKQSIGVEAHGETIVASIPR